MYGAVTELRGAEYDDLQKWLRPQSARRAAELERRYFP
jgi:hypothetical protein